MPCEFSVAHTCSGPTYFLSDGLAVFALILCDSHHHQGAKRYEIFWAHLSLLQEVRW